MQSTGEKSGPKSSIYPQMLTKFLRFGAGVFSVFCYLRFEHLTPITPPPPELEPFMEIFTLF